MDNRCQGSQPGAASRDFGRPAPAANPGIVFTGPNRLCLQWPRSSMVRYGSRTHEHIRGVQFIDRSSRDTLASLWCTLVTERRVIARCEKYQGSRGRAQSTAQCRCSAVLGRLAAVLEHNPICCGQSLEWRDSGSLCSRRAFIPRSCWSRISPRATCQEVPETCSTLWRHDGCWSRC